MFPLNNDSARHQVQDTLLNNQALDQIRTQGRERDPEALKKVAQQFEAIFVQQMLKQMRASNQVFGADSYFNSNETQFHQDLLDQQLSLEMSQGRGIGLADAFYQQMLRAYGDYLQPEPVVAPEPASMATGQLEGGKTAIAQSPAEFVAAMAPHAQRAAEALGVNADVLLAQAALETGWGRHVIHTAEGDSSFNLFNIKADQRWSGERVNVSTLEFHQGVAQQERANFRRYQSYAESFADYVNFLQTNPRYRQALSVGEDSAAYAEALQQAGYATDPEYAEKIQRLLDSNPIRAAAETLVATARDHHQA